FVAGGWAGRGGTKKPRHSDAAACLSNARRWLPDRRSDRRPAVWRWESGRFRLGRKRPGPNAAVPPAGSSGFDHRARPGHRLPEPGLGGLGVGVPTKQAVDLLLDGGFAQPRLARGCEKGRAFELHPRQQRPVLLRGVLGLAEEQASVGVAIVAIGHGLGGFVQPLCFGQMAPDVMAGYHRGVYSGRRDVYPLAPRRGHLGRDYIAAPVIRTLNPLINYHAPKETAVKARARCCNREFVVPPSG